MGRGCRWKGRADYEERCKARVSAPVPPKRGAREISKERAWQPVTGASHCKSVEVGTPPDASMLIVTRSCRALREEYYALERHVGMV